MPLAKSLARRYHRGEEPLEDLEQVAALGLLKAIKGFDPDRGSAFASFAVPTIVGELRRHFRDKGWAIRVPRDLQELALAVQRKADVLQHGDGPPADRRSSSPSARARRSRRCSRRARRCAPCARPRWTARRRPPRTRTTCRCSASATSIPTTSARRRPSRSAGSCKDLPERERKILALRFGGDLTQSEIGERARHLADARVAAAAPHHRRSARASAPRRARLAAGERRRPRGCPRARAPRRCPSARAAAGPAAARRRPRGATPASSSVAVHAQQLAQHRRVHELDPVRSATTSARRLGRRARPRAARKRSCTARSSSPPSSSTTTPSARRRG